MRITQSCRAGEIVRTVACKTGLHESECRRLGLCRSRFREPRSRRRRSHELTKAGVPGSVTGDPGHEGDVARSVWIDPEELLLLALPAQRDPPGITRRVLRGARLIARPSREASCRFRLHPRQSTSCTNPDDRKLFGAARNRGRECRPQLSLDRGERHAGFGPSCTQGERSVAPAISRESSFD